MSRRADSHSHPERPRAEGTETYRAVYSQAGAAGDLGRPAGRPARRVKLIKTLLCEIMSLSAIVYSTNPAY